jgi:hypothetical protein
MAEFEIRVTKYDPRFRDTSGRYLRDEWTSISDVGKYYDDKPFKMEQYLEVEERYIKCVTLLFESKGIDQIKIVDLERYEHDDRLKEQTSLEKVYSELSEGDTIALGDLGNVVRLILRECLWCFLKSPSGDIGVRFGYDYYMYFFSREPFREVISKIFAAGLYVD